MRLPSVGFAALHEALVDAYDRPELELLTRTGLNCELSQVAGGDTLPLAVTVRQLIQWAERADRVKELVRHAQATRAGNAKLNEFVHRHGYLGVVRTTDLRALQGHLERLQLKTTDLWKVARRQTWRSRLLDTSPNNMPALLEMLADAPTSLGQPNRVCLLARAIAADGDDGLREWLSDCDRGERDSDSTAIAVETHIEWGRRRASAWVAASAAIALLGGVAWWAFHRPPPPSPLSKCIQLGRDKGRPYVLQSVLMQIGMYRDKDTGARRDRVRTVYTVIPLTDFAPESKWFEEWYGTNYGKLFRWRGSVPETELTVPDPTGNKSLRYFADFAGTAGSPRTIVTGVEDVLPATPPPSRVYAGGVLKDLPANEDAWVYPNKDDVICEFGIVLEGIDWVIAAKQHGALRQTAGKLGAPEEIYEAPEDSLRRGSLSKRWENVLPNEDLLIHYTFVAR